jgi:hypothetical protein
MTRMSHWLLPLMRTPHPSRSASIVLRGRLKWDGEKFKIVDMGYSSTGSLRGRRSLLLEVEAIPLVLDLLSGCMRNLGRRGPTLKMPKSQSAPT